MKLPNNFGTVTKLSGRRRKPYTARVTVDCVYDEDKDEYVQKRKYLGYYATKAEAIAALTEYNNNPYSIIDANMTLNQVWDNIKDNVNVSDNRKAVYKRNYEQYFGKLSKMKIKDVKTKHLQQALDDCPHGYSTKSIMRAIMRHIFSYACQNDIVQKDYTQFLELEQEAVQIQRQVYTDDEIKNLWKHKGTLEYDFALVLLHEGMRIKELRDLTKDCIDLDANTISIKTAKNKYSIRTIPIHKDVITIVTDYYNKANDGDLIFPLKKRQFEIFADSMLNHTPYDTRHTFATKANELNLKTMVIQRIMGHKPDNVLSETYIHLTTEELAEEMNKITFCNQFVDNL